jgi:hypothetical protein
MKLFKEHAQLFLLLFVCVIALGFYMTGHVAEIWATPILFGMSNVFLYRMPAGIPGDVQRREHATIETGIYDTDYPCLAFGILTKIVSGEVRPIASGDTISSLTLGGWLCRPYPIQASSIDYDALAEAAPNTTLHADLLKRGYMAVKVTAGGATALADIAKGDAVYVRTTAGTGKAVGDVEAGSAEGNEVVSGAYFMGGVDADGYGEIAYNI